MANQKQSQTEIIPCTRYTYDAWMKTNPQSNMEEWKNVTHPENISYFIMDMKDHYGSANKIKKKDLKKLKLKIVTIDDEYYKWLKDRKDCPNSVLTYINEISEAKALDLLRKNGLDTISNMYFIPIFYYPKGNKRRYVDFKISNKTKEELEKKVAKTSKGKVLVSNTVIPALNLLEMPDEEMDYIFDSLMDDNIKALEPLGLTVYEGDMLPFMGYIPIKITYKVDTVVLDENKYTSTKEKNCIFPGAWKNFLAENEELYEQIQDADLDVSPFVVALDELKDVYIDLMQDLQNMIEKEIEKEISESIYTA